MIKLEDKIQSECWQWHWINYPNKRRTLFAVPNGGRRDPIEVARMKAAGLLPGVSDLVLLDRGTVHLIEMKRQDKGRQSDDQKKFQIAAEAEGLDYYLIDNVEDFKKTIKNIYAKPANQLYRLKHEKAIINKITLFSMLRQPSDKDALIVEIKALAALYNIPYCKLPRVGTYQNLFIDFLKNEFGYITILNKMLAVL